MHDALMRCHDAVLHWKILPRGLYSTERDRRVHMYSRNRTCLQEALHGECDAGPVYHPVPGVAKQVLASMPLQARLHGKAVLPGLPVTTDGHS